MTTTVVRPTAHELRTRWMNAWEAALATWSPYTKLKAPKFCIGVEEEAAERLTGSFAMIRLADHTIVIGLEQVLESGVEDFALEILAHEIGHHVFVPGDLADNARLLANIRAGIPTRERQAPMLANLYADLLINDRLQRGSGLDMAGVYKMLKGPTTSRLWALYMRIYEILWELSPGTLTPHENDPNILRDAPLGARLIRHYAAYWLDGAGRFAALCLPYLLEDTKDEHTGVAIPWLDAILAGLGGELPDGLATLDPSELDGAMHPVFDDALTGFKSEKPLPSLGREAIGGFKNRYRPPAEYADLMRGVGVQLREAQIIIQYYRELARPHMIKFPTREAKRVKEPIPEGVDIWEPGAALSSLDWFETIARSPIVIPGITTVERVYGEDEGADPKYTPVDLYLGVDCSGSMTNPSHGISYPVIAGAVMILSALRAGAKVQTTLSGEPGEYTSTGDYSRDAAKNLGVLTGYLGTGYAFGIERLAVDFVDKSAPPERPVHIVVLTDSDIFYMVKDHRRGREIVEEAPTRAGGGASLVLDWQRDPLESWNDDLEHFRSSGWDIYFIQEEEDLVKFARDFSKRTYQR